MTGNFAFCGIDMALWDLCGKIAGVPIYQMLGGAMREEVDYFCYLQWQPEDVAERDLDEQCREGVAMDYRVFYIKVGIDTPREEGLLSVVRERIGPTRKLRIDVNQAWSLPEARDILPRWHERFRLDFVEAPVAIEPLDIMLDLKRRVSVPLCANEGLWRETDVLRIIEERAADYLCFNSNWVGSLLRFHTLARLAGIHGLWVCKHSHPELGIAASAGQHLMLAAPKVAEGSQHHARMLSDDVVSHPIPIAVGPRWGRIEGPGLGVEVDEKRLLSYHQSYLRKIGRQEIVG
jgi:L-alanine-DL-glutamate epimerase-like enolase superfamily enzyme